MCIGIPLQIAAVDADGTTWCLRDGARTAVDTDLVGPQPVGTWLLVFLDSAREVLDETRARDISQALDGLAAAIAGEEFEHFFRDLIDREPQLPPHLRPTQPPAPSDTDTLILENPSPWACN
ncbi:MAG: HypC/HybG/HupF family hydrogenase formation chaperone [Acidihalobacter sp.]|jgi:hydrogenase expression/formation protein HypC|uniref:HypC/HybG/HupF family hydrogenase formation chaperone n=1 Tax=Acidihalobacter sp. TaxID=1872108 RepID=UPI00307EF4E8